MTCAPARREWTTTFFTIWAGQAFSLLGSMLVQFALVWWLTATTGSGTVLATAALAALLPEILLGPFAGACVDRWNRRLVMLVADSLIALATLGLAALYALGVMRPWHVYLIMMLRAAGAAFHWPAMQASTSLMVPREHLSRVAGINQTLRGALGIVSPPLGAILVQLLPLHSVLLIDAGTAALAILPLVLVAIPQPERRPVAAGAAGDSLWQDLREGLRYVWGWPGLCLVGVMATVINLMLNPASALMPILVTKHFRGGALELGWIESAWGLGVVLGGLLLGVWGGFRRRILTSLVGLIGMGLACMLVGLAPAPAFGLALGAMFAAGLMNPITNGPLFAAIQATVAPEMQGRVFTLMGSVSAAMSPLGMAMAGPVADAFGVGVWFVVGGVTCALMGVAAFFVPQIVHLEEGRKAQVLA